MGEKQMDDITVFLNNGPQWKPFGKLCNVNGSNITDDILEDTDAADIPAIDHFDNEPIEISGTLEPIPWRTVAKLVGWQNFIRWKMHSKLEDICSWWKLRLKAFQHRRIFHVPVTTRRHIDGKNKSS